jgi:hypothetical protein
MSEDEKTVKPPPPWTCEPPERPDPGDWRLDDPRSDEEALRYRERLRASWERDA